MAMMLGPSDFGLPSFIPPPTTPLGRTIVQALMGKHGVAMPPVAPHAASDAGAPPVAPPQLGSMSPGVKAGADVAALPTMDVNLSGADKPIVDPGAGGLGGADLQQFADSASIKKPGFLDRIDGFLKSDDGRATMMRFAAGAFNGGLGGGLGAATSFADQRRREQAAGAQQQTDNAFKTQELGDNRAWHLGQLDNEAAQNANTAAYQRGQLTNDEYRTTSENWRSGLHEQGETGRVGMQQQGEDRRTAAQLGERQFEHVNPSGDTVAAQAGATYREQNPVATPPAPHPNTISLHAHYTTTPQDFAANGPRLRPSQVHPNTGATQIGSDADYNALPSGARFVGPDGQVRIKP